MKDVDGRAALRCWPVMVEVGEQEFHIAARPAIDWILPIVGEDWLGIVPGLIVDDSLSDLLATGEILVSDCVVSARDAVAAATGMRWWSAVRLVQTGVMSVDVSGSLVLAGVDPCQVSIGAYVAAVYRVISADRDKKERTNLDHEIERIPPGIPFQDLYDPEQAAASFEQMFSRQG